MTRPSEPGRLSDADWDRLQDHLDRFEEACQEAVGAPDAVDLAAFLPQPGDPLRPAVLHELVKTDLEVRWRSGRRLELEDYVRRFPELGGTAALPPGLLYEECRVRHRFGDRPAPAAYQARFPAQWPHLEELLRERPVGPAAAPAKPAAAAPPAAAPAPAPAALAAGTTHASGGYRLVRRLNRGAFGDVWRAEAPARGDVAVKIIFGSVSAGQRQREQESLETIKRLRHPSLLPVHGFWVLEDRLMIAMELAEASLRDRLEDCRRDGLPGVPRAELVAYFRAAAEALDYLHGRHVLHRDLKPENILLLHGQAKVSDFDLARLVEQTRKLNAASTCGTPAYAAPEVFGRGEVGPASDQYSLAAVYVELRAGRPLFPGRSLYQVIHDHLQRPPDLAELCPGEQAALHRALAKDPAARYPDCRELARALEEAAPA